MNRPVSNPEVVIKRSRYGNCWVALTHNPQLIEHLRNGLTDAQIGKLMGFTSTTIGEHRRAMGLRYNSPIQRAAYDRKASHKAKEPDERLLSMKPDTSLLDKARIALHPRVKIIKGQIWLDDLPSTLNHVMQAWNYERARMGFKQFTNNPAWEVKCQ